MKLSVPFLLNNAEYITKADEYDILYDDKSTPEKLTEFAKEYSDKRINIYFGGYNIEQIIAELEQAKIDNFAIVLDYLSDDVKLLQDKGWKYFTIFPASSFYDLEYFLQSGVCDVYLANELWHNLPKVKEKCGNVRIRMIANHIASFGKEYTEDKEAYYTVFVPRPEDYILLDKYIDVIQFDTYQANYLEVLYKTWFINHKWIGYIQEIMSYGGKTNFLNSNIPSDFTESKISCGGRCLYDSSCKCRKCRHSIELANKLADKGLEMK